MDRNSRFEHDVIRRLGRLRRRLRLYALADGAAPVLVVWLGLFFVQLGLDYSFRLPVDMRAALLGAIVLGVFWVVFRRVIQPARVRVDVGDVARLVERKNPHLGDLLISAVEFRQQEPRPWRSGVMMDSVVAQAGRAVQAVSFASVLNHRRAARRGSVVLAVLVIVAGLAVAKPDVMALWFQRNVLLQRVSWPQRTHLRILGTTDGRLRHLRGEDLALAARVEGVRPRHVNIEYEYQSGTRKRERMIRSGPDRFIITLRSVSEPLRFRMIGGDDETDWMRVELVDAPAVEALRLHVAPPAYTGLDAYEVRPGQSALEILKGGVVTAAIRANKPLVEAVLMRGRSVVQRCEKTRDPKQWNVTIRPGETAAYHFDLKDAEGFGVRRPRRFSVRVLKDQPPQVRLRLDGVGEMIVPGAVLPVELSCEDRYGLADVAIAYEIGAEQVVGDRMNFDDFAPKAKQFIKRFDWDLHTLGLDAGQRIIFWAEADDFDDVSGPNKGESAKYALAVVTPEELQSELARREQESQQAFEQLLNQQEELRLDLLSAVAKTDGATAESLRSLEQRQRHNATRARAIADQFGRVLGELEINQLSTAEVQQRIGEGIVSPLRNLSRGQMTEAAETLAKLAKTRRPNRQTLDNQQQAIIEQMRAILASMVKWEGYQEVVGLLRNIVKLQNAVTQETHKAAAETVEGFFGTQPKERPSNQ